MKVIIVPLNDYFYYYQKFDGLDLFERLKRWFKNIPTWVVNIANSKGINSFFETKFGSFVLVFILAFPVFLILTLLFILPLHIWMLVKHGSNAAAERNKYLEFLFNERVDVLGKIDSLKKEGFELIIYYNKKRIPRYRNRFLRKIEMIRKGVKPLTIIQADEIIDISNLISEYKVDVKSSYFISDGFITFSGFNKLIN